LYFHEENEFITNSNSSRFNSLTIRRRHEKCKYTHWSWCQEIGEKGKQEAFVRYERGILEDLHCRQ
jgi:hypothetical protein